MSRDQLFNREMEFERQGERAGEWEEEVLIISFDQTQIHDMIITQ